MRKKAIEMTSNWNKDLKPGDAIEGKYIKKELVDSKFDETKKTEKYIIETPEGEKVGVFSSASLGRQFANIPVGSYVWITYQGEEVSKNGRPVKVYDVYYDDEA